jgi:two-component system response regulator HydG
VRHDWPGNVRELENTVERLVVLSPGPYLEPADLVFAGTILTPAAESSAGVSLKDLERHHIIHTLQRYDGHKSETARALGIDRKTLREKLKRYNIE